MTTLTPENATDYLQNQGILNSDEAPVVAPLAWGVSNVVLRVNRLSEPDLVIKQSQDQLRTKVEWFSQRERIFREVDVLRYLNSFLPKGIVPNVLFEDRENFVFGMEAIEADHKVWKGELLANRVDVSLGKQLGNILASIHAHSSQDEQLPASLQDWQVFDELRIDPFYRYIARNDVRLKPAIDQLIESMTENRVALVLADFSPKNILIREQGLNLVDFETAHWGDPAFDLGFFLSHLWLKVIALDSEAGPLIQTIRDFCQAYEKSLTDNPDKMGSIVEFKQRSVQHLGACMIARVEGKSPVEYLQAPVQKKAAQKIGRSLLFDSHADWSQVESIVTHAMAP